MIVIPVNKSKNRTRRPSGNGARDVWEDGGGVLRVKSPQDLGAGLVFVLIGVAGAVFGRELTFGTAARMGPGYFPILLSYLIIGIGLIVAARGLTTDGPALERFRVRPLALVLIAIVASGYLLSWIGLFLTTIVITFVAAFARPDVNLRETLLLGTGMGLFAVLVFVYALGQPLPAWWGR